VHEKLMDIAKKRNRHKRLTTPDDVARCIVALCLPTTYWMAGKLCGWMAASAHLRIGMI
jgi:hypothetical protein